MKNVYFENSVGYFNRDNQGFAEQITKTSPPFRQELVVIQFISWNKCLYQLI